MKWKHLLRWIKDKNRSINESRKTRNASDQTTMYGYDDFRNYPFGIMEHCGDFSNDDIIRIKEKIKELGGCDGNNKENANRNERTDL